MEHLQIIIVLYQIALQDSPTYSSLVKLASSGEYVLDLYIYDNSLETSRTKEADNDKVKIKYVHDPSNSGISKAYNKGAAFAKANNKEYLLLLDQDTTIPINFFQVLQDSMLAYPSAKLFAPILMQGQSILSPCKFKYMRGTNYSHIESGIMDLNNNSIFNSGMVVKLDAFFEVGGYNERIKLDLSDHCFIERFKSKYNSLIVLPIVLQHDFSSLNTSKEKLLSRFTQYCSGVQAYRKNVNESSFLLLWTALRSLKLMIKYRDIGFFKTFLISM